MAGASGKAKKVDPFKTRKTKTEAVKISDTLTPPDDIQEAIDKFRENQDQARHYEGEATVFKDQVLHYAQDEFTKRCFSGLPGSFKIMGAETMVTFVVQDSSAGLTEEDVEDFSARWGEEAAEELITRDFRSIRFSPDVLEANYDDVVQALQSLPEEVINNLFKPMLMKAKLGAIEKAKKYAKTPEELKELMSQLKIKNYVR